MVLGLAGWRVGQEQSITGGGIVQSIVCDGAGRAAEMTTACAVERLAAVPASFNDQARRDSRLHLQPPVID